MGSYREEILGQEVHIPFESIKKVAREHFTIDPCILSIAVYSHIDNTQFLFIEVNTEAIPTGKIQTFCFAPSEEFAWPMYIANITPAEWEDVKAKTIPIPRIWVPAALFTYLPY